MDLPLSTLAQEPEVGAVVEVVAAPEAVEAVAVLANLVEVVRV